MREIKLSISEDLLLKLQEISDYYKQTLDRTIEEMAKNRIRGFDVMKREIAKVSDEDVEFLFNDYPDHKHPNPNNVAKITSIFQARK